MLSCVDHLDSIVASDGISFCRATVDQETDGSKAIVDCHHDSVGGVGDVLSVIDDPTRVALGGWKSEQGSSLATCKEDLCCHAHTHASAYPQKVPAMDEHHNRKPGGWLQESKNTLNTSTNNVNRLVASNFTHIISAEYPCIQRRKDVQVEAVFGDSLWAEQGWEGESTRHSLQRSEQNHL